MNIVTRLVLGAGLLVGTLALQGCVVAIGNSAEKETAGGTGTTRCRLSSDERRELPVVTSLADLPTVSTKYAGELSRLTPHTTLAEFRQIFPMATFVERRAAGGACDAYSVRVCEKYRYRDESYGYVSRDEKWFYFKDDVFVKWGDPGQWPG
jgi:hypothetical protein